MKFATFVKDGAKAPFLAVDSKRVGRPQRGRRLDTRQRPDFVRMSDQLLARAHGRSKKAMRFYGLSDVKLLAPLPNPVSFRDFMVSPSTTKAAGVNKNVRSTRSTTGSRSSISQTPTSWWAPIQDKGAKEVREAGLRVRGRLLPSGRPGATSQERRLSSTSSAIR